MDGGFVLKKVDRFYKVLKSGPFSQLEFQNELFLQLLQYFIELVGCYVNRSMLLGYMMNLCVTCLCKSYCLTCDF
jgi:hypothetical protein